MDPHDGEATAPCDGAFVDEPSGGDGDIVLVPRALRTTTGGGAGCAGSGARAPDQAIGTDDSTAAPPQMGGLPGVDLATLATMLRTEIDRALVAHSVQERSESERHLKSALAAQSADLRRELASQLSAALETHSTKLRAERTAVFQEHSSRLEAAFKEEYSKFATALTELRELRDSQVSTGDRVTSVDNRLATVEGSLQDVQDHVARTATLHDQVQSLEEAIRTLTTQLTDAESAYAREFKAIRDNSDTALEGGLTTIREYCKAECTSTFNSASSMLDDFTEKLPDMVHKRLDERKTDLDSQIKLALSSSSLKKQVDSSVSAALKTEKTKRMLTKEAANHVRQKEEASIGRVREEKDAAVLAVEALVTAATKGDTTA